MSKYEWEKGTIKIPSKEYVPLRKKIIAAFNTALDRQMNNAKRLRALTLTAGKNKRNFNFFGCAEENSYNYSVDEDTLNLMFEGKNGEKLKRPINLTKNKMGYLNSKARSMVVDCDSTIAFNDKERTVRWTVTNNNHAVRDAHDKPLAKALFAALRNMTWTRGSGGEIVGNDELNADSEFDGDGSNYVNFSYQHLSAKEKRANEKSWHQGWGLRHNNRIF